MGAVGRSLPTLATSPCEHSSVSCRPRRTSTPTAAWTDPPACFPSNPNFLIFFCSLLQAQTHEYADCYLDPQALPLDKIKASAWRCMATHQLGTACCHAAGRMRIGISLTLLSCPAARLPAVPQAADALVTGTLGLAGGPTADAMRQAVAVAREARRRGGMVAGQGEVHLWHLGLTVTAPTRLLPIPQTATLRIPIYPQLSPTACRTTQGGHTTVVIDVNRRPVFWDDEAAAKAAVLEYIQQAHILKVTDEVRSQS